MFEEKEKKKETDYEVVQVPTDHTIAIRTPDEKVLSIEEAIAEVLNELKAVRKALG